MNMKAVILAGGKGTRLCEETVMKPKPMVEIGGMPILWHIMKIYSAYGINDFVICCGYKQEMIKQFFANYYLYTSDVSIDLQLNRTVIRKSLAEPWRITLVDTGLDTMTAGRLKKVKEYIGNETFCLTYGDGVSDVNISKLVDFHMKQKTIATVTATHHFSRFGMLHLNDNKVNQFLEKPRHEGSWMNSGFFVLEPQIFDYIHDDSEIFEQGPIQALVEDGQLSGYEHNGFFQGMDSMRDKLILEELWQAGQAPWKVWTSACVPQTF